MYSICFFLNNLIPQGHNFWRNTTITSSHYLYLIYFSSFYPYLRLCKILNKNFLIVRVNPQVWRLVGVGKSSHARHDTEHVVVGSIDTDSGGGGGANSVVGDRE